MRVATPALALLLAAPACASNSRDVIPETREVRGADAGATPVGPEGYVYIAKRPHGLVALADSRGIAEDALRAVVDHLADELDACAVRLAQAGKLAADGAGRVVAAVGADGAVTGMDAKAAPGRDVAANLLVCVASPLKLVTFPPDAHASSRGLALEATWHP